MKNKITLLLILLFFLIACKTTSDSHLLNYCNVVTMDYQDTLQVEIIEIHRLKLDSIHLFTSFVKTKEHLIIEVYGYDEIHKNLMKDSTAILITLKNNSSHVYRNIIYLETRLAEGPEPHPLYRVKRQLAYGRLIKTLE